MEPEDIGDHLQSLERKLMLFVSGRKWQTVFSGVYFRNKVNLNGVHPAHSTSPESNYVPIITYRLSKVNLDFRLRF